MTHYPKSQAILSENSRYIPGGVVSTNRAVDPPIVFERADGAWMWDVDGNRYLDYHAAFGPYVLGHNDRHVNDAVRRVIDEGSSLYGSGTTKLEGQLAHMICDAVPFVDSIQVLNTGSEATYQALRLARAATGRSHILKPQGGYHGWHNDVACNLMTPLAKLGPRRVADEYPFETISAGIPQEHSSLIHAINFNDLESVEAMCRKYPIAALITEPILQNIGIVHPLPGYLEGLRALADKYGFVLIFDEVKTGFRHALGGYSAVAGVAPDLVVYGKAIANGYPLAVIGGKKELMDLFVSPDATKRVLLAGTYNGHPIPTAAAIATIERLAHNDGAIYRDFETLGQRMQSGLEKIFKDAGTTAVVARQGSAFCTYFMDHLPVDWHDLATHHDTEMDAHLRRELLERGVYFFQLPMKQCSLSAAHTEADVDQTLEAVEDVLAARLQTVGKRATLNG
ncbi:glutamate-1-semialdehyde 2,1-aminomutase [Granulicella pectinivorans]|jgi:glutamate-1-semialdehyde 2,1-aminomutase|uniref:Glutamate-1-semialdehyde 2,1-aminomutase n=1 Tax=Granulicella pectinivorans TaxID=474950 RepID=A0A1I6L5I5_9BACT|nr:aspartate aminotransferase family protein [Granulicella pectinivorans]SFR98538.1 glutamate-1-semialdehyde 2,1-aminomutase [Granulicella pectinivorans]